MEILIVTSQFESIRFTKITRCATYYVRLQTALAILLISVIYGLSVMIGVSYRERLSRVGNYLQVSDTAVVAVVKINRN